MLIPLSAVGQLPSRMKTFKAQLDIIGVNPFVPVPEKILEWIFTEAHKDRGPIPIKGTINGDSYRQTLMKFKGSWRLYVNTSMLKNSPKRIGELLEFTIAYDSESGEIETPIAFLSALDQNKEAKTIFDNLTPSLRLEIVRYIDRLKTEESLNRNITRAINFLLGKERFIGRDQP